MPLKMNTATEPNHYWLSWNISTIADITWLIPKERRKRRSSFIKLSRIWALSRGLKNLNQIIQRWLSFVFWFMFTQFTCLVNCFIMKTRMLFPEKLRRLFTNPVPTWWCYLSLDPVSNSSPLPSPPPYVKLFRRRQENINNWYSLDRRRLLPKCTW